MVHLQRDVRKPDCPVGAVHPQLSGPRRLSDADPASTPTEKVGRSTSINRLGTGKRLDPAANDVKQHGEAGPQQDEVQFGFGTEASRCVEHAVDPAPDEDEVMQASRYGSYHRSASTLVIDFSKPTRETSLDSVVSMNVLKGSYE